MLLKNIKKLSMLLEIVIIKKRIQFKKCSIVVADNLFQILQLI